MTDTAVTTDMLAEAAGLVITSQFGSQSMLQRKMRLNFHTAGLVMDRLEAAGVVGPHRDDGRARDVLVLPDRYAEVVAKLRQWTGGATHDSDSAEQRAAEPLMLAALSDRIGVALAPCRIRLSGGAVADLDGADVERTVLVEVWAHQGTPRGSQPKKVLTDALKLLLVADVLPRRPDRLILCLSDPAAAAPFTTARSWAAVALRRFGIDVEVVDLPAEVRAAVEAAQDRQFR